MRHMWGNEVGRGVTIRTARKQHQQDNQLKGSHFMCRSGNFSQAGEGGGPATDQDGPDYSDSDQDGPDKSRPLTFEGVGIRTSDRPPSGYAHVS